MKILQFFLRPEPVKLPTPWQLVFMQSRVNNDEYLGDPQPPIYWAWPRNTWLQRRLEKSDD